MTREAFVQAQLRALSGRRPGECLARLWPSSRFDVHVCPYIYAPFAEAIRPSPPPAPLEQHGQLIPGTSSSVRTEFRLEVDEIAERSGVVDLHSLVARPFSSRGRACDVTVRSRASLVVAGVPDDRV